MKVIATALILWINANSAYDYAGDPPRVVTTDPESLAYLMLGEIPWIPERAKLGLKGLYDPQSETIWLRDDFDPDDPADRSHLLHELVHFMQYRQADAAHVSCGQGLEREAYDIQNLYLAAHGLPPVKGDGVGFAPLRDDCLPR